MVIEIRHLPRSRARGAIPLTGNFRGLSNDRRQPSSSPRGGRSARPAAQKNVARLCFARSSGDSPNREGRCAVIDEANAMLDELFTRGEPLRTLLNEGIFPDGWAERYLAFVYRVTERYGES